MNEALRLGDHCSKIGSGATPRGGKDTYSPDAPVALIRSQNVLNEHFTSEGLARISEEQAAQLQNVEVLAGDVLLNITGDSVARVCQVDANILPARVNQHVSIIRPFPDRIDARFLRYFLVSPQMQSLMLAYAAAGATRNALTKGMIEDFRIPYRPIDEQRAIACTLGVLDNEIELNRRMNKTLEAMARAIFKDWFVDFGPTRAKMEGGAPYLRSRIWALFPHHLDEQGTPEGWKGGTLADIAFQVGESVSPETLAPETPYIGLEHMPRRSIALEDWEGAGKVTSGKLAFKRGDFLFGKLRPYFHKVGIAPLDGICSTDIVVLNAKFPKARSFVISCISQDEYVAFTDRTSDGTKMPRTSWGRMQKYEICIPTPQIFEAFDEIASPLFDRLMANIHESKALAATRDLLLPKLMTSEIRVSAAEKMAEAAL